MVFEQSNTNINLWVKDQLSKGYSQQSIRQRLSETGYDNLTIDTLIPIKKTPIMNSETNYQTINKNTYNVSEKINETNTQNSSLIKGIILIIIIGVVIFLFNIFASNTILSENSQTHQDITNTYNNFLENEFCYGTINESFAFDTEMCNIRDRYKNNLLINNSIGIYSFNYESFKDELQEKTGDFYKTVDGDLYNITAISLTQLTLFNYYTSFFRDYFIYDSNDERKDLYFDRLFINNSLSYPKMIEINKTEKSDDLMSFCFTAFSAYLDITKSLIFEEGYPLKDNYTNMNYSFFETFIDTNINIYENLDYLYQNNQYDFEPYWAQLGQDIKNSCLDNIRDINSRLTINSVIFDDEILNINLENTGQTNILLKNNDYIIDGVIMYIPDEDNGVCETTNLLVGDKTVCKINTSKLNRELNATSDFKIEMISRYGVTVNFEYEGK